MIHQAVTHRLSGLLNNSTMNAALPTIFNVINVLSELECCGQLPKDPDDTIYINYNRFKKIFAQHYSIQNAELTWKQLATFINAHSFDANEIIFSPITRYFIADTARLNDYSNEDISALIDIQPGPSGFEYHLHAGRFKTLGYAEMAKLFYYQLGVSIRVLEFNPASEDYELTESHRLKTSEQQVPPWFGLAPVISLYLKNGHVELRPHNKLLLKSLHLLPNELMAVHDELSSSQTVFQSNKALARLFLYVSRMIECIDAREPVESYWSSDRFFYSDTLFGRQTLAVVLLTISSSSNAERALFLMQKMEELLSYDSNIADALSRAVIESAGDLESPSINAIVGEDHGLNAEINPLEDSFYDLIIDPHFQLKCIIGLAAVGATLLCAVVILTSSPIGVMSATAAVVTNTIGSVALLASAGLFAYRQSVIDSDENEDLNEFLL